MARRILPSCAPGQIDPGRFVGENASGKEVNIDANSPESEND